MDVVVLILTIAVILLKNWKKEDKKQTPSTVAQMNEASARARKKAEKRQKKELQKQQEMQHKQMELLRLQQKKQQLAARQQQKVTQEQDVSRQTEEKKTQTQHLLSAMQDPELSDLIKEVYDRMIVGYDGNLAFERDFLAEGMDMLNQIL